MPERNVIVLNHYKVHQNGVNSNHNPTYRKRFATNIQNSFADKSHTKRLFHFKSYPEVVKVNKDVTSCFLSKAGSRSWEATWNSKRSADCMSRDSSMATLLFSLQKILFSRFSFFSRVVNISQTVFIRHATRS